MVKGTTIHQIFLVLFGTFIVFGVHAIPLSNEDAIERGDAYVDKLVKDIIEENADEYDPYNLEDRNVGFSKKILFVNISGEAKLHKGVLTGLKTLHRAEHCTLEERSGRLDVQAVLGAGEMNLRYDGSVKFMDYGPSIEVHGLVHYIEVDLSFSVDSETGKDGKLLDFTVRDMRKMKVSTSGLGPLTWAMNPIINGVTKIFQRFVKNLIEKKIKHHLSTKLPSYQFPIEGIQTPIPDKTESVTQESEQTTTTVITTEESTEPETVTETDVIISTTEQEGTTTTELDETTPTEHEETPRTEEEETPSSETEETLTPEPEETQTPKPEETPSPEPEETETPEPEETPSPEPEETETPEPEETPSPEPEETEAPQPEETPNPEPEETNP